MYLNRIFASYNHCTINQNCYVLVVLAVGFLFDDFFCADVSDDKLLVGTNRVQQVGVFEGAPKNLLLVAVRVDPGFHRAVDCVKHVGRVVFARCCKELAARGPGELLLLTACGYLEIAHYHDLVLRSLFVNRENANISVFSTRSESFPIR